MGLPKTLPGYTVDEYLALERESEERHTYLDGQLFAMAGESIVHGHITVNLVAILAAQLKGTPCAVLTKDTKVRSGPTPEAGRGKRGLFSYPDAVVICGEPECHDAHRDVILNPTAIFEVLSPTTEAFDRGEKFNRFLTWNATLTDYVLISQDQPRIEHYFRQAGEGWSYFHYTGLEASVVIESIRCELKLVDVYDRVTFPEK